MSRRRLLRRRKSAAVTSFPVVEDVTPGVNSTSDLSSSYTMGATVNSGDLLVIIAGEGGPSGANGNVINSVLGTWSLALNLLYDGNFGELHVWILRADGTEDSGVETATSPSNRAGAYQVWRISGAFATGGAGTAWDIASFDSGGSTTPDPPSVTATWGSDKNLFITATTNRFSSADITGYPTNYDDNQTKNLSNGERLGVASRNLEAATDNPGTFATSGTVNSGGTMTMVIRPAAAA